MEFNIGFMRGVAGGAFPSGHREMNIFGSFKHIPVFCMAGETEGAFGGSQKMFIKSAVGIVALEALFFFEWPVLEFLMTHVGMTFLVQTGEFFIHMGVVPLALRDCRMTTAALAF